MSDLCLPAEVKTNPKPHRPADPAPFKFSWVMGSAARNRKRLKCDRGCGKEFADERKVSFPWIVKKKKGETIKAKIRHSWKVRKQNNWLRMKVWWDWLLSNLADQDQLQIGIFPHWARPASAPPLWLHGNQPCPTGLTAVCHLITLSFLFESLLVLFSPSGVSRFAEKHLLNDTAEF